MHKPGPALEKYIATVQKWRWAVIAFWAVCLVVGGLQGLNLLKAVKLAFDPPSNSPSAVAQDKLTDLFPEAASSSPIALVMHRVSDESILGSDVEHFSNSVETFVMNYVNTTDGAKDMVKPGGVQGMYTSSVHLGSKSPFIGGANSSWTIININILIDLKQGLSGKAPTDFCKALLDEVPKLSNVSFPTKAVEIKMTGLLVFGIEVLKGTEHDLLVMDGTAFPLALIVLASILKSGRLLIIPGLSMIISIVTSYLIMWPIALHMTVISFAPSVMMSAVIAMSIDYSLFLLSRYREEMKGGRGVVGAVLYMTWSAGHTVLVSGSTLVLCFLSLMFFPTALLSSSGLGCAIAIAVTIVVNLTLTPALLLTFPNFFEAATKPAWSCCGFVFCGGKSKSKTKPSLANIQDENIYDDTDIAESEGASLVANEDGTPDGKSNDDYKLFEELRRIRLTRWYKFAARVSPKTAPYPKSGGCWYLPWLLVLILTGLAIPCGRQWGKMQTTTSFTAFTPRTSEGTKGFAELSSVFGPGTLFSYFLIVQPKDGSTVLTSDVFKQTNLLLLDAGEDSLAHLPVTGPDSTPTQFIGPSYITALNTSELDFITPKGEVDVRTYTMLLDLTSNCTDFTKVPETISMNVASSICSLIESHVSNTTGTTNAIMTSILLGTDPFAEDGMAWLKKARAVINKWKGNHPQYDAYLGGGAAINTDVVDKVYGAFPMAMGITAGFVLIWIGMAFRSILVPLRAIFTLAITIIIVYGCSVYVFQDGALDWMHFPGLSKNAGAAGLGALSWVTPVMSFSIVVGLGLDYDVFLICRVSEYRQLRLPTRQAIAFGLAQTGPIITAAGAVMALAFAGLLFSAEPTLNELSFYLVFAVLFDTLVIRTMLVPALMSILGEKNWWPRKLPKSSLELF